MHAGRGNIPRNCDAGPANALQILVSSAESLAPLHLPHAARQPVLPVSRPAEHGLVLACWSSALLQQSTTVSKQGHQFPAGSTRMACSCNSNAHTSTGLSMMSYHSPEQRAAGVWWPRSLDGPGAEKLSEQQQLPAACGGLQQLRLCTVLSTGLSRS